MNVISLCDESGIAVEPWARAGYDCFTIDLRHPRGCSRDRSRRITRIGADVLELHPYHRWLPDGPTALAMAWPACTHFSFSGQRWRRQNGPAATAAGFQLFAACWDLLRFYERERGAAWLLEQPQGIPWSWCKPDHTFHPWQYGGGESKLTGIWCGGSFVMPAPIVTRAPRTLRASVWRAAPGPDRAARRSKTPAGFAGAVFAANHRAARQERITDGKNHRAADAIA